MIDKLPPGRDTLPQNGRSSLGVTQTDVPADFLDLLSKGMNGDGRNNAGTGRPGLMPEPLAFPVDPETGVAVRAEKDGPADLSAAHRSEHAIRFDARGLIETGAPVAEQQIPSVERVPLPGNPASRDTDLGNTTRSADNGHHQPAHGQSHTMPAGSDRSIRTSSAPGLRADMLWPPIEWSGPEILFVSADPEAEGMSASELSPSDDTIVAAQGENTEPLGPILLNTAERAAGSAPHLAVAELHHGLSVVARVVALTLDERGRLRDQIAATLSRHGFNPAQIRIFAPANGMARQEIR